MANPLLNDEQRRRLASQNNTYNQIMQGFEEAHRQQQPKESLFSGATRGAKAGLGSLGAGLLHAGQAAFGTDGSTANALEAMAEENAPHRDWSLADTFSLDYLTDPDGLAYGLGQIVGSMAIPALVGAGVATAVPTGGTSTLGLGALIGAAGAAPMAVSEGGNTYAQGLKQGMSEEEAKRAGLIDAGIKLPFYMLSEGVSGKVAQGLISKGLLNAEGKSLSRRAADGAAKVFGNAANEAYEEGTENRSSAYALGDPRIGNLANVFNPFDWNDEDKAQAVGVFTPTLALGALTGGAGHLRNRFSKQNNTDVSAEVDSEGGTIEEADTGATSTQDAGREAFINAIAGQESGGNYDAVNGRTGAAGKYQIMPENWPAWAEEAGLGADAEMTPENQEIVARHKLGEYYDKYGARGAAMAWYAGEGSLNYGEEALNRKQGNGDEPSINEYADSVLARMGNVADTARIDDSDTNYFDESDYTDPSIIDATTSIRGFDVSNLGGNNEAVDSNSLRQFEELSPEAKTQREAYESEKRRNKLMQEIMAAGNTPARGRQYAFTGPTQNADALDHGFSFETINNAKAFDNKIKTNNMRKRARVGNVMPNYNFGTGLPGTVQNGLASIVQSTPIPSMMQTARSPREMANATNYALQYNNLLRQNYSFEAPQQVTDSNMQAADRALAEMQRLQFLQAIGASDETKRQLFMPNVAYNFDYLDRGYEKRPNGEMRRRLAAQNRIQPEELPSVEPTPVNRRALESRNFIENVVAAGRANYAKGIKPTSYDERGQYKPYDPKTKTYHQGMEERKARKLTIKAKAWLENYNNNKDKREMLRNAAITVWTNDPKHPMRECRKNLNQMRTTRKDILQPIVDVMTQGMKQGVSLIPANEFDGQDRGRKLRASNNAPWYSKYYKENKKAPSKSQLYNIAEDIFFGNDEYGVGYYSDIKGKEIEQVISDNHDKLDFVNNAIDAFETLELKLKENPNYGKEWAKNQTATKAREVETTGNSKTTEAKTESTTKSDKDEVKASEVEEKKEKVEDKEEKQPEQAEQVQEEPRDLKFTVHSNGKESYIVVSASDKYPNTIAKLEEAGWKKAEQNDIPGVMKGEYYAPATEDNYNFADKLSDKGIGYNRSGIWEGGWSTIQKFLEREAAEREKRDSFLPKGITAEVKLNDDLNGVEVKFSDKPGREVTTAMHDAGYKWSSKKQLWYAKQTSSAMNIAEKLGYKPVKEETPTQETKITQIQNTKSNKPSADIFSKNPDALFNSSAIDKIAKGEAPKEITDIINKMPKDNAVQSKGKESTFNGERAKGTLDKLFGKKKTKAPKANDSIKVVDVFDESKLDDWIKKAKDSLNRLNANPMFDPDLMNALFHVGGIYAQKGINKFADWSRIMVGALGEKVKPYLTAAWKCLGAFKGDNVDSEVMQAVMEYVGSETEKGRSIDEVQKELIEKYGEELKPYIQPAYVGVQNWGSDSSENVVQSNQDNNEGGDNNGNDTTRAGSLSQSERPEQVQGTESGEQTGRVSGQSDEQHERPLQRPENEPAEVGPNTRGSDGTGSVSAHQGQREDSAGASGRGTVPLTPAQKKDAKPIETPGHNYTVTQDSLGDGGVKTKYQNNVKAIKLLKQLEAEGRAATPAEQEILANYVGWGGLSPVFNVDYYRKAIDSSWAKEAKELRELLTDEEYKAARASTTTAFYTPVNVIKNIYKALDRIGFKGGKVLEPSMGTGNFFGVMPESMRSKSSLNGVELDPLTGRIAKQLYQKANIEITGFEKANFPDGYFDLAISNVPFGNFELNDSKYNKYGLNIHNYFFIKAMDKVRPGGIVCFVTSTDTMQGRGDSAKLRQLLKGKADFVGAIRLPDTTFKGNANTTVTSDVIILQKRKDGAAPSEFTQEWLNTVPSGVKDRYGSELGINEYYKNNPEMVIGELKAGGQWGSLVVDGRNVDISKDMAKAINKLPAGIYEARTSNRNNNSVESAQKFLAPNNSREGTLIEKDGKVYHVEQSQMVEMPKTVQKRALDYVGLRDTAKKLLAEQVNPSTTDEQLVKTRAELNKAYDKFVKDYGPVNDPKNIKSLSLDPDYGVLEAIEDYKVDPLSNKVTVTKRAIFSKRTVNPIKEITHAENVNDALTLSMSQTGGVNIGYMSKLMNGKSKDSILKELDDRVYENPITNEVELAEAYLSGNVREKLEFAETAAKTDKRFEKNVEALKKIQPKDLEQEDVSVSLGAPWIPASDIQAFTSHLLGNRRSYMDIKYIPAVGTWKVDWGNAKDEKASIASTQTWGTKTKNVKELLEAALNQSTPTVYSTDIDGKTHVDQEATIAAQAKLREIQDEFRKWIWADKSRAERLLAYYNRNFNNWVLRSYDGSALNFPGYSTAEPQLKQHQKDVVWRILQDGTCLMAHCVGAGKTWSMQTAAMELKRLGLANKSMFVVPNHMLQQFENEFRRIYPNAKLLTISSDTLPDVNVAGASKLSKAELAKRKAAKNAKRQSILGKIATEDWDGIIISHNIFKRIPMSPEAYNRFYEQQIEEVTQAIIDISASDGRRGRNNFIVKTLEKTKKNLESKLKKNVNEEAKDIVIPFEQLGVDQIFVDEADLFKNLHFTTKMKNIAGMSQANSQRSMDMFMKTQYLINANNGRGVVFATGTPISNTMAEMFTMLRYLDNKGLKDKNLGFFDNWAATFATKEQTAELAPDGSGYRTVDKFTKFNNMPELIKMFRKVADVKKIEDLDLKIPKLKNGKPTVVEIPMNSALETYIKQTAKKRATAIHNKAVDPREDNMLKLTGDLRKASLDMRLVDPSVPISVAGSKVKAVVDHVADKYKETSDVDGVQLVFCDLSTPKGASDKVNESDTAEIKEEAEDSSNITVYAEIKKGLIKKGIPANQIAFIHDAKNKTQKEQLFERCRQGQIRVLIGSTEKMGAGTNIQKKLVAEHHVDAPWRPRDIEQREGRILRQGNDNKEVEIFNYVTKGSFDANMWEKLKNKAIMIGQAMSGNLVQRSLEDADATVLSFAEVEALASGNPLMAERVMVNAKLTQMEALAENYRRDQEKNKRILAVMPNNIKVAEANAEKAKADIANRKDISGDNFSMVIGRNKTVYAKRTDAKAELERIASHYTNELGGVVAKAGGFDIRFRAIPAGKLFTSNDGKIAYKAAENTVRAEIVGENTYFCEPTLGSIEYAIMHAPDKALETANRIVVTSKEEMKQLEAKINEPFKYADEYESLKKRSAEIEEELNRSSNQTSDAQYSVSDEATTRSRAEVEAEIRKALPSAELERQEDGSYIATMPNGKKLGAYIEDQILLNEQQAAEAERAHNRSADEAEGYWNLWERLEGKNVDGVLRVSRNSRIGTAFHETLHAAMDLCLTGKEKAALYKSFARKARESGRNIDEEIADAYKDWAIKRQQGKGSMFGKLFQKAKDFLNKLYTMFVEAENKGNIFRKLESGRAWENNGNVTGVSERIRTSIAQAISSADTSLNQIPAVFNKIPWKAGTVNIDIGGGRFDKATNFVKEKGVENIVFDPFNRDYDHNSRAFERIKQGGDTVTVANVLNVIAESGARDNVILQAARALKEDGTAYFAIYEGSRDGVGKTTTKGWQNNMKAADYMPEVKKHFAEVQKAGNVIIAKKPILSEAEKAVWSMDDTFTRTVKYSVAPNNKIASAFTNTERKGAIQSAKDFIKEQKKNFYTDMVDKNNPLKGFDELTKAAGGLSVYDSVQNLPSTTAGMLKAICEGNALSIKAANQHLKNVKMKHNVTLAMALDQINKKDMDKAHPNYLAANGFNSWVNAFGAYLGAERLLEMNDLAKAEGKVYKFPKGLTEAELKAFVKNVPPQFRKAADMFYKVNDNMISVMEDAQVFSPEVAKTLRTKYRKYCPLLRDFSDTAAADTFINGLTEGGRGIGNVSVPLKRINITGSERGVMNPLESVLKSYAVMLNRAERNKVGLMAVDAAKTAQLHNLIKEIPEQKDVKGNVVNAVADPKKCIFTVLVNGKKKAYQTTQELYAPIVGYNLPAAGLCINVARMAAHMLRTGATMSPSFIVRNLMRDTVFAGISSKNGFTPIVDSVRGAMALWKDPALRAEFEAAGVTEFNFYGSQNARIKSLDAMAGEKPVGLWEMIKWAGEHLEAASDFVESSTRMGEFMKARQKGLSMEEAARAAREVTLDFSRSGVVGEQINRYVPFFNACIQGGDKMVRLFREDPWGTSQKLFQYIVLPSIILWAMTYDEDWYKDLDPDVKNNYWCLGESLRIPKPQEAGVLFGSGVEALLDQANGKDKDALKNMAKAWVSNMVPSIVPTLFLPLLEWQANYSFFKGRELVGSKYQRLPSELQYNDYTSELSKAIGNNPVYKVSPMKVDNLIRGYTGTMGGLLWSAPDAVIGSSKNLPEKHLSERTFFRDFTVTDANKSRPMNNFYDILDKANRQHAGYGVKGRPAEAVKGIRTAGSAISKIRKDIDKITNSNLTPQRKRELIDKRKEKMNQIAKKATERYGKYFE